jgi:hypothetical protein
VLVRGDGHRFLKIRPRTAAIDVALSTEDVYDHYQADPPVSAPDRRGAGAGRATFDSAGSTPAAAAAKPRATRAVAKAAKALAKAKAKLKALKKHQASRRAVAKA